MTPFHHHQPHAVEIMVKRELLLAQPDEFFAPLAGKQQLPLQEKLHQVELCLQRITCFNIWHNDTYRVEIARSGPYVHLDISRHDGQAIIDWSEFQQIKNALVGAENEAVQLFPSEQRLVDTAHQYHLWVHADPHYRFPFGLKERLVLEKAMRSPAGRQIPLDGVAMPMAA